jgi:hypothetical protein
MNTYKQLLPRTILLGSMGLAAMLLVSTPSCKAQEVSPDHFTDTGVQNVYEGAPAQVAAPAAKQSVSATQSRAHKINSAATVQPAAKRNLVLSANLDAPAVDAKRKPATITLPKQ